ncbi:ABC transporter ATP-binding protein [Aliiroseovarius subalbicans]|uniref:ABC transporter ATP-binding protein n=1 Tax=Aliiroseovarius subalbicans TaxID=2925840 RepID=UPI001F58A64B|nr:ABC transporter ATP-binding protein [Aliiroseovarius subalbicans]MCI2399799.1 ABC transporter ATP-binding protein [Aliiroseovarius subalbicans]
MIQLSDLWKTYTLRGRSTVVARGLTARFATGRSVGLLGRNGAGKSSLLRMIAGTMDPDGGTIRSDGTISWPVGYAGSFHPELTGAQNTSFIARVYGIDTEELRDFVQDFSELGQHFHQPFRTYSSGMRSRLAFGVSMGIHFDTYLVDEVTAVGDAAFRRKSEQLFMDRMTHSSALVVTHSLDLVKRICDEVVVLENGHITRFGDVEEGIAHHRKITG